MKKDGRYVRRQRWPRVPRDDIEMEADEKDIAATANDSRAGPNSGITIAAPRFKTNRKTVLILTDSNTPQI